VKPSKTFPSVSTITVRVFAQPSQRRWKSRAEAVPVAPPQRREPPPAKLREDLGQPRGDRRIEAPGRRHGRERGLEPR
jgi:hypothetical protein